MREAPDINICQVATWDDRLPFDPVFLTHHDARARGVQIRIAWAHNRSDAVGMSVGIYCRGWCES
jgi:hypothetical protein